jgi:cell division protein FtsL
MAEDDLPSPGAIAGIVIGGLVLIASAYIAFRKWQRKDAEERDIAFREWQRKDAEVRERLARLREKAKGNAAAVAEPPPPPPPEQPDTGTSQHHPGGQRVYAGGGKQPHPSHASA